MANKGLVIGRFQLVGNHHTDLFEQIVECHYHEQKLDSLNVGIGVSDTIDFRNPFSGTECWQMVKPVAQRAADWMGVPLYHRLVDDINDPVNYAKHVSDIFGFNSDGIIALFTNNKSTIDCFIGDSRYATYPIKGRIMQHATDLRNMFTKGIDISDLVPEHIPPFLEEHNAKRRMQRLKYNAPDPTVDMIIEYNGGIVVIERGEEPIGYALPGGHIDYGETAEYAAVREAKEETGLDVKIKGLVGVYSDPKRDPRCHKMSIAYFGEGYGTLKPGDDAKRAIVFPLDEIPKLLFDHDEMIKMYKAILMEAIR